MDVGVVGDHGGVGNLQGEGGGEETLMEDEKGEWYKVKGVV